MKIIFFGTPDFVIPVLDSLIQHFDVVGIVTSPDHLEGRKKILTPSPVKAFALKKDITTIITPDKLTDAVEHTLRHLQPDLFVVAAYGKIIPKAILEIPSLGALNIHPSLLPKYRGPSPIQTALKNGDKTTGITIIKMDQKMDHGPLIYQEEFPLSDTDTFDSLHLRMFQKAASVLPDVITDYTSGNRIPVEQNHNEATYCHMITKEDGYIAMDALPDNKTLDRMIRAYYPWPTVWTKWKMSDGTEKIVKLLPDEMIQLEGGKPTTIKDLLNGHPHFLEEIKKLGLGVQMLKD